MLQIIQKRKIYISISIVLVAASLLCLAMFGLRLGIDFTGGSLLEVSFKDARPAVTEVEATIAPLNMQGGSVIQQSGDKNMILRFQDQTQGLDKKILEELNKKYPEQVGKERFESIGPAVGKEIKTKAIYAILLAIIAIMIYIALAFRKVSWPVQSWKYAVAAIVALVHDIIIPMGVFAVLGHLWNVEINLTFVAAMLTILGYSINDTIVIFDRIRENIGRVSKMNFEELVNRSINETLPRSINTVMTVLIMLFAILIFGGESIRYFALALIIGVFSGGFSSIFIASPILVIWERWGKNKA
jgi:preprotein translocase subunit SecF